MNFIFSDIVLERALESSGEVEKKDIPEIIKKQIRDDFDLKVTNNELVTRLLQLSPSKVEELSRSFSETNGLYCRDYDHDTVLRLFVFAYVMANDALKFKDYRKLWNGEPMLYARFNNISHDDRFLAFHFDEFDE